MKITFHLFVLLVIMTVSIQSCIQEQSAENYFLYSTEKEVSSKESTVKRMTPININRNLLDDKDELKVKLFGEDFNIVIKEIEREGDYNTYYGSVNGDPYSSVLFYFGKNSFNGSIELNARKFEISGTIKDAFIKEMDHAGFRDHEEGFLIKPDKFENAFFEIDILPNNCQTIDVLVVYTEEAKEGEGGVDQIETRIGLAFMETNTSFINSGVEHEVKNVGMVEVDFDEPQTSGISKSWMQDNQEIAQLRSTYKADIVILIVNEFSNRGVCGSATTPSEANSSYADRAFAVVSRGCMTGFYTFGHEIGHLMGARHNCEQDDYNNYRHGFSFCTSEGINWRTIMSYEECNRQPRILFWSNPENSRNGVSMGTSSGDCQSNNVKTLNEFGYIVANYTRNPDCFTFMTICDRYPFICEPEFNRPRVFDIVDPIFEFSHGGAIDVDDICKYVLGFPCCGADRLCPDYTINIVGLHDRIVLKIIDEDGKTISQNMDKNSVRTIKTGKMTSQDRYFLLLVNENDKQLDKPVRVKFEIFASIQ